MRADLLVEPQGLLATSFQLEFLPSGLVLPRSRDAHRRTWLRGVVSGRRRNEQVRHGGVGAGKRRPVQSRAHSTCMRSFGLLALALLVAGCGAAQKARHVHAARGAHERGGRSSQPGDRAGAAARGAGLGGAGRGVGAVPRRRAARRRAHRRRRVDGERRARRRPRDRLAVAAARCTTRRPQRSAARSTSSAAATACASSTRSCESRRARRPRSAACRRRAPTSPAAVVGGAEYVVGGYTGTHVARHDRPLAPGPGRARRRSPARRAALRRGGGGRRADRDRRRLDSRRHGERRRALVRPGDRSRDADRPPARPTTHAAAAALGTHVVRDRRAQRDRRHADRPRSWPSTRSRGRSCRRARSSSAALRSRGRRLSAAGSCSPAAAAARERSRRSRSSCPRASAVTGRGARAKLARPAQRLRSRSRREPDRAPRAPRCRASTCRTRKSNTVDVIDPRTFKVVDHFAVGGLPQHVVPSYDLKTSTSRTTPATASPPIDPQHGQAGADDPRRRSVQHVLHARRALRDRRRRAQRAARLPRRAHVRARASRSRRPVPRRRPHGLHRRRHDRPSRAASSRGSCSSSTSRSSGSSRCSAPAAALGMPQDVKLSPDGRVFYVADMVGERRLGRRRAQLPGHSASCHTGRGAHGLYPSRDARYLYVSNRGEGSISVISFATRKVVHDLAASRAAAAPTWAASRPTARCCGCRAATTASSTRSRRRDGQAARAHPGRRGPARPLRLAAARPLLARPHRHPALGAPSALRTLAQ